MAYPILESNITNGNTKQMAKISYKNETRMLCGLLVHAREEVGLTQNPVPDVGVVSQRKFLRLKMIIER